MPGPGEERDEVLAERCRDGDLEAFAALYERYRRPILAYLWQIVRDYDEAGCIAHDVFLKLFTRAERFDSRRRFATWLYAVARHAALDRLRARQRRVQVSFADLDEEGGIAEPADARLPPVEAALFGAEAKARVARAVSELPQIYREIIELIVYQELSYEEASAVLGGISPGTLRSRMFHALRLLRARLRDDDACAPR
ncbi:MAG: sigma-70 family RNA polymerase sigma factor [Planctomycetota bacterium]|nr:sigma-70 family RNA polymerase sigma factor [Planctomycetota bacterium]MCX8039285.1 sigma-70 family RNA polymerase sigma factor [Planctomycetota bacterium]MDW8372050.1 sigma-70 family RNA polymerase sigma factor [Planctomycetota bacterium]